MIVQYTLILIFIIETLQMKVYYYLLYSLCILTFGLFSYKLHPCGVNHVVLKEPSNIRYLIHENY